LCDSKPRYSMVSMPTRLLRNMATLLVLHGLKPRTGIPFSVATNIIQLYPTTNHTLSICKIINRNKIWSLERKENDKNSNNLFMEKTWNVNLCTLTNLLVFLLLQTRDSMASMPTRLLRNMATLLVLHGLKPRTGIPFSVATYIIQLYPTTNHTLSICKIINRNKIWSLERKKSCQKFK
jgi:hypothetical protein